MSFCRWSDDDYQCDVYCYESCYGGFVTHVADNRPVLDIELPPRVEPIIGNTEAWVARHEQVMDWVENAKRVPIGLPYDGKHFSTNNAKETAELLQMLKEVGYNVPQYAIDALFEEGKLYD